MAASILTEILATAHWWTKTINYEIVRGNEIWRFGLVLLVLLVAMAAGRIVQFTISRYGLRLAKKRGENLLTLLLKTLANPIYVAIFAAGIFFAKAPLFFHDEQGIRAAIAEGWTAIARVVASIAAAYALYRLVDVIEYYLNRLVGKTETKLDDMLVPVVRKALRVTIAIVAALLISENILGANVKSLLLSAGVGGIAIALAAKETIANFFGSITILADRPFQMGELVKIDSHFGPVEEVGFRSTRVRTLEGHLVTIPNSVIVNSIVENVGRRPFIRRTSNITITYDSGYTKAKKRSRFYKKFIAGASKRRSSLVCRRNIRRTTYEMRKVFILFVISEVILVYPLRLPTVRCALRPVISIPIGLGLSTLNGWSSPTFCCHSFKRAVIFLIRSA